MRTVCSVGTNPHLAKALKSPESGAHSSAAQFAAVERQGSASDVFRRSNHHAAKTTVPHPADTEQSELPAIGTNSYPAVRQRRSSVLRQAPFVPFTNGGIDGCQRGIWNYNINWPGPWSDPAIFMESKKKCPACPCTVSASIFFIRDVSLSITATIEASNPPLAVHPSCLLERDLLATEGP